MFPPTTHILLVDDMKGVRVLLSKLLRELGFQQVTEAENGNQAYQILKASTTTPAPIGLVISDWRMPEMDGLDFLKKVRAEPGITSLPFILLTAESEKTNVMEAAKHGVSEYIVKPTSAPILSKKLASAWAVHFPQKK